MSDIEVITCAVYSKAVAPQKIFFLEYVCWCVNAVRVYSAFVVAMCERLQNTVQVYINLSTRYSTDVYQAE